MTVAPDDVKKAVHADAIRTGFLETDVNSVRMVSRNYPLPVDMTRASQGVFGEQVVAHLTPRVQVDSIYGIRVTDVETFTATGGSADVNARKFRCQTGTSIGGYGVIRSKRAVRYRPGFGARFRFTAQFSTPAANSLQWAGVFSSVDFIGFGYNGTSFGVTRRVPGSLHIEKFTVTAGSAGGGETITVTLDGTGVNTAVGGSLSTAEVARELAETSYTGWEVAAVGDDVYFMALSPEVKSGAFTYGTTGSSTATNSTLQVGAANDNDTDHIAQASWVHDTATWLDPEGLNIYEIEFGFLGAANLRFRIYNPSLGRFVDVHCLERANDSADTTVNVDNPSLKPGWIAASLGSTTNLTVQGASMMGAVEGELAPFRNPRGYVHTQTGVSTESNVLSVRNARVFGDTVNQQEILPRLLAASVGGSKPAEVRVYIGATLTDALWTYGEEGVSCAEICTDAIAPTGGRLIAAQAISGSGQTSIDLSELEINLGPTEILTVTIAVSGGAGNNATASLTWLED